jgi:DNA polymerase-3 subunit delta'
LSVWDLVVGQVVVTSMRQSAAEAALLVRGVGSDGDAWQGADASAGAMTHAWLITGPPGSGRSVVARAFAAALECTATDDAPGCGVCQGCRTALAGTHPDVHLVATESLTLQVDLVRDLVRQAAMRPAGGRWQVLVIEDADRLTDEAADALLLSLEEPPARTVWLLCAPASEDISPTIRSRCRTLALRTPPVDAVASFLVGEGVDPAMAAFAARAAQGHIGRARALATDEQARHNRDEVLRLPIRLTDAASALAAAAALLEAAEADAGTHCDALEASEAQNLVAIIGSGRSKARGSAGMAKDLQKRQKSRRTRATRDFLDRALVDVLGFYRDVLRVQSGADAELINDEMRPSIQRLARSSTPTVTARRMAAVVAAREALAANAAPLLTLEALALALRDPAQVRSTHD